MNDRRLVYQLLTLATAFTCLVAIWSLERVAEVVFTRHLRSPDVPTGEPPSASLYHQEYPLTYFPHGAGPRYGQTCSCDVLECVWPTPDKKFQPALDPNQPANVDQGWKSMELPPECHCKRGATRCDHMYMT